MTTGCINIDNWLHNFLKNVLNFLQKKILLNEIFGKQFFKKFYKMNFFKKKIIKFINGDL